MIFTDGRFLLFIVPLYVGYWCVTKSKNSRKFLLLCASYVFYSLWDWRFLGLLLICTLVNYLFGFLVAPTQAHRRKFLILSIVFNCGFLGLFRYYNFFLASGVDFLNLLGFNVNPYSLKILLPVGISFYTFKVMSYSIDIYRNQIEASHNLLDFALFVGFFPQLMAGPIERPTSFLPQLSAQKTFS